MNSRKVSQNDKATKSKLTRPKRQNDSKIAGNQYCEDNNYLGITLCEFRKKAKMTQVQAAEKLQVTQALWSAYELGKARPTLDSIIAIAKVLNVDPLVLIKTSLERSELFSPDSKSENKEAEKHADMQAEEEKEESTMLA